MKPIFSPSYYDANRWPGEVKDPECLAILNDGDASEGRWLFHFGAYGWTRVLVIGHRHLEDALDAAVDFLADHAPGLLCDVEVREAYDIAIASGKSEDVALSDAETDVTIAGNEGHYISEWSVEEDTSREHILDILGRSEPRAEGEDPLPCRAKGSAAKRFRGNRAA